MSFPPPNPSCKAAGQGHRSAAASAPRSQSCHPLEGEHQLEKLEFALAIALTRGDAQRSHQLREEIAKLGGNQEEPGT
ncbi:MAG: hypothetical protein VKO44_04230 [Cyanobacteriota bacterium]|nr:hypothetical protein [Cyanobacteriota bacterium]